jgi:hypothetical protein
VIGGLLTAAGFATTVWEVGEGTQAYHDSLVANPFRSQVAALLLTSATSGSCRCCSPWGS